MRTIVKSLAFIATALGGLSLLAPSAKAADPFYKGKTLTLLVNFAPGGGASTDALILSRHLGRNIPGNPRVVTKNMAGGGGVIALNFLGEVAKPDGKMAGFFTSGNVSQFLGDPGVRVDIRDFGFVGAKLGGIVVYIRKDVKPGINTAADILKAQNPRIAGTRTTGAVDLRERIALDMLGVKHGYTTGYRGTAKIALAVLQNEAQIGFSGFSAYYGKLKASMEDKGMILPLFHFGYPSSGDMVAPFEAAQGIPTFYDLHKKLKGEAPSGPQWKAINKLNGLSGMLRWAALPKGSPPAALAALRQGFAATGKDPQYIAEVQKRSKETPQFLDGAATEKITRDILSDSSKEAAFLKAYAQKTRR